MIETFRGKSWRPDRSLAFFLKRNDYVLLDDIVLEARNKGAVLLTIPLNLISKFFDFVQLLGGYYIRILDIKIFLDRSRVENPSRAGRSVRTSEIACQGISKLILERRFKLVRKRLLS